jgi:acetyl esterase/lipase
MKLRDKIVVSVAGIINMNPEKKDRAIKKIQFYTKLGMLVPHRLKRGYERARYDANGAPFYIYKKKGTTPKKLIYIVHGGAFILGLINTYRNLYLRVSRAANDAAVALIDYRLAPAYQYPAAHDDLRAGWELLQELGYEPRDIVLMGDSAGGNMVLSLLLRLRDEGKPLPAAAAVMSPWIDFLATGASYKGNYSRDALFGRKKSVPDEEKIKKLLAGGVFSYVGGADKRDPYLSPVLGDYHGMPPILMTAGSYEMLLDDTLTVAEKLKAAGGDVRVIIGAGMFHAYPLLYQVSPTAKETFKEILAFLKTHTV